MTIAKVYSSSRNGAGPAQPGGLMTVIEYFISGILCIFQNQMECHFFFQERWGMSLSSFPIQTTYTMASKMNGTGNLVGRRGETEREREDPSLLCPIPASLAPHCCLPHPLVLEPTILQTTPAANWGYIPVPNPHVVSVPHRDKPRGHLIHPSVSKKHRASDMKTLLPDLHSCS